jgi:hypothetical protein
LSFGKSSWKHTCKDLNFRLEFIPRTSKLTIARAFVASQNKALDAFTALPETITPEEAENLAKSLVTQVRSAVNHIFTLFPPDDLPDVTEQINTLLEYLEGNFTAEAVLPSTDFPGANAIVLHDLPNTILTTIMTKFGFDGPEESEGESLEAQVDASLETARLFVSSQLQSYFAANCS